MMLHEILLFGVSVAGAIEAPLLELVGALIWAGLALLVLGSIGGVALIAVGAVSGDAEAVQRGSSILRRAVGGALVIAATSAIIASFWGDRSARMTIASASVEHANTVPLPTSLPAGEPAEASSVPGG